MGDNYWFEPKDSGVGIVPICFEGRLLVVALLLAILASAYATGLFTRVTLEGFLYYLVLFVIEVSAFGYIAYKKTKRSNKRSKKKK